MNAPRPCDRSKNVENVPTTAARCASSTPTSASVMQVRVHQRHPDREDHGADDEPRHRRPGRDHDHRERGAAERERPAPERAELVGQPGAEDADREDQHAVEQEEAADVLDADGLAVQREERGEAGERDQPEEHHGARDDRGPVQQRQALRRRRRRAAVSRVNSASTDATPAQRRGDDPHRVEPPGRVHRLAERGPEREPAVHRDRPVRDRLAPPLDRARGR